MRSMILGLAAACCLAGPLAAQGYNPVPTCSMCPGTYVPVDELQAYTKKAIAENRVDQQVRDVEIGRAHIGIGMVYRGKLDAPAPDSVAEHDLVRVEGARRRDSSGDRRRRAAGGAHLGEVRVQVVGRRRRDGFPDPVAKLLEVAAVRLDRPRSARGTEEGEESFDLEVRGAISHRPA